MLTEPLRTYNILALIGEKLIRFKMFYGPDWQGFRVENRMIDSEVLDSDFSELTESLGTSPSLSAKKKTDDLKSYINLVISRLRNYPNNGIF